MLTETQTDILTHWSSETGVALRPEFSGRFLLADGTLTEDSRMVQCPRDEYAKFLWHMAAGCFLCCVDEDGAPTSYQMTTNPPTTDVEGGYKPAEIVVDTVSDGETLEIAPVVREEPSNPAIGAISEPVAAPDVIPPDHNEAEFTPVAEIPVGE